MLLEGLERYPGQPVAIPMLKDDGLLRQWRHWRPSAEDSPEVLSSSEATLPESPAHVATELGYLRQGARGTEAGL